MSSNTKVLQWLAEGDTLQTKEPQEEPTRKSYDKKIVGWLDMLGIRAKIKDEKTNDAESIINIMSEMASYVSVSCDKYVAENVMSYLQIADGFMIVADLNYANQVCSILADIQWKILINLQMLSRGAITAGNVSVANNGSLIIGPAYVDAYAMESENAIYARTIISEAFLSETHEYLSFKYIKEDTDKTNYIDYIHYIMDKQGFDSKRMHKILVEQGICRELKKSYDPKNTPKINIRQKYGWTISLLSRNKIEIF